MSWRAYIADTMTGRILTPIDLPSFSWQVTVDDASLSTTKQHEPGSDGLDGITIPWAAVNAATPAERRRLLAPDRRSIVLFWLTGHEPEGSYGTPWIFGAIGQRSDSVQDTSFALQSMMDLLDTRYMVREGVFAAAKDHTSTDEIKFQGKSLRAIACAIGQQCTSKKPAGTLPIDWPYLDEKGKHERTYESWDIQNLSGRHLLELLAGVDGGPDMQFRPYLAGNSVRMRFFAGSDADVYLGQKERHRLSYSPLGGTIEKLQVDYLGPVSRVYATGSGTDKALTCDFVEDLALNRLDDPWPLRESVFSDSDADNYNLLSAHAKAQLEATKHPVMQISGTMHANDMAPNGMPLHPIGSIWPGEIVELDIEGFPSLDDGLYECRLMSMEGDQTDMVRLTFDVMDAAI